jgi:hypothetical protein
MLAVGNMEPSGAACDTPPNDSPRTVEGSADQPAAVDGQCVPRGLSLAERVETGYVNPGWTGRTWADRLRQLADRCEALRPDLAAQYRTWAANVQKNGRGIA